MRKYAKILFMFLLVIVLLISSFSNVFITYVSAASTDVTREVASQFIQSVDIRTKVGTMSGATLIDTPDLEKDTVPLTLKADQAFQADLALQPDKVTVQKNGALVNGTDIGWTITVNKENVAVNNAVLVDMIPDSQILNELSIRVNGGLPPGSVIDNGSSLSIALGNITTRQVITFTTSLKETALLAALEAGDPSIPVRNTAYLEHDDNETTNVDSPKTVTIPLNILSTSGSYDATTTVNNTKNITWTIVVNEAELAFNNAIIKDTLPAGLTYIAGTATVNGTSVTPVTSGSELTFNLGNITNAVTITYETEIEPARFQTNGSYNFINEAVLTWDGLTGTGVEKNASVGVGSNFFNTSGAGYNRANGVISWSIDINSENINWAAPTITDSIPSTQQYIQGSVRIVDHQGSAYAGGAFNYNTGTSTLRYTFGSAINSRYTITFDTKPANTDNITANFISSSSSHFSNTASISSGTITRNSTGTQSYTSNVLKKDAEGYDLNVAGRKITWKLTVNENGATTPSAPKAGTDPSLYAAIALPNVSIVDTIPAGLTFIPSSVRVLDRNSNPVTGLVTVSGTDVVTFDFNSNITEQYTIYFDTAITDLSKFISQNSTLNNGNFNVKNEATLIHDKTTRSTTDSATQTVSNHIVSKKGIPTTNGNKYIDWVVYLNSNAVNLNQLLDVDRFWLIDNLQAGLELDTTSVELIAYGGAINVPDNLPANGNDGLGAGTPVLLDGSHIVYDATTREFRFNIPNDTIDKAYKLSFRTYVTETVASGSRFSNMINLFGSKDNVAVPINGAYQSNDSRQVTFLEAGSMGYGNLGKLIVKQADLDDNNVKLSGATFALYDQYGNKVQEKVTVNGELEFNRIKYDLPYYVKEVAAPTGYLLSRNASVDGTPTTVTPIGAVVENAIPLTLTASHTPKYLELVFANEEISSTVFISPVSVNFDKKVSAQTDVRTTMTLNGNTLTSVANGLTLLTLGTDYTVVGNTVTFLKAYLASQSVGTTNLIFTFSGGATQTLAITVSETTPAPGSGSASVPSSTPTPEPAPEPEKEIGSIPPPKPFYIDGVNMDVIKALVAKANSAPVVSFKDVPAITPNAKAIGFATKLGIINGYDDGSFRARATITRAEFASMLVRALGLTSEGSPEFKDTQGHWAANAIAVLKTLDIAKGYLDGTFKPDQSITRAEIVAMLSEVMNTSFVRNNKFKDVIGHWAEAEIGTLSDMGIVKGTPDGVFRPNANATRYESLLMILRMLNASLDHSLNVE
ncbi:S-layer homology domain-containing protein [Paenibacillus amylolyticus]|uniref:S-layer domain protein n=1 Tax=Paenibacillus amylolyticus TaxID=1451 RepID=A0A100VL33_PAEAM|nr:S-layer homology domain-containing protein [Paenibacillus amylolyticus]GAS81837.1 S-layer domain protein [Paenibacillus amylolyticus]